MKKETYLKRLQKSVEKIKELTDSVEKLKKDYIKANTEFEIGSRVRLVTPMKDSSEPDGRSKTRRLETIVYVSGYEINDDGRIVAILHKESKKERRMLQMQQWYNPENSFIERIEEEPGM